MSIIIISLLTLSPLNVFAGINPPTPLIVSSSFTLSFQGYDYDNKEEVVIFVNSKVAAVLPAVESPQNSNVFKSFSLNITEYVVSGSNTITFRENSSHASGMKNVKVIESGGTVIYSNSTYYTISSNGITQVIYRFNATVTPPLSTLVITANTVLTADHYGGIQIAADGVTLDGNGYSMIGGDRNGLGVSGRSSVIIKNLNMVNFTRVNAANGKNIAFIGNTFTRSYDDNAVYVYKSTGMNFINNKFVDNDRSGVVLEYSNHTTIIGNTFSGNFAGVEVLFSHNYTIANNRFTGNFGGVSVAGWSHHINLTSNIVSGNSDGGISIGAGTDIFVVGNTVSNNGGQGIGLFNSPIVTTLTDNTISNNDVGIRIEGPHNTTNIIYRNNLVNNSVQISITGSSSNLFNLPAPVGGNYWSNYDSAAEGCSDTSPVNDFCDSPYSFTGGQDNLPWTKVNGWLQPPQTGSEYTLTFQGYDYDNKGEVFILVNNQQVTSLPAVETTLNNNVFRGFSLDISEYVVSGGNTVVFKQNLYSSAVKDVKVTGPSGVLLDDGAYRSLWVGGTSSATYRFATEGYPPLTVDTYTFNINDGRQRIFNSTDVVRVGVEISGGSSGVSHVTLSTTGPAGYSGLNGVSMNLQSTGTGDWLSGWNYRKFHVINTASGAGSGYQVKVVVHRGTGSDLGGHVYLNNNVLNWPNDIRFTGSDRLTQLGHWLESSDDSTATFWLKVNADLSSTGTTVYIYYGKAGAPSASNGNNVFAFFDDFSGSSIDGAKWTVVGSGLTWSIDSGSVKGINGNNPGYSAFLRGSYSPGVGQLLHAKVKLASVNTNAFVYYRGSGDTSTVGRIVTGYFQTPNLVYMSALTSYWDEAKSNCNWSPNTWYNLEITEPSANSFTVTVDGACSTSNSVEAVAGNLGLFPGGGPIVGYTAWYDDVYVRKHASPEPSQGSWGSEERAAGSTTLYNYYYDYALPNPPPGAYYAIVSVEFNDGSSELSYNWFKSMRQTITDNGPWTTTVGGTALLSFSLSSLGSESHDSSLFIDLPNSAVATSATLDSQPWILAKGSGAATGFTRYYVPYIYIDTGATRIVNFNVQVSSTAAISQSMIHYFSTWETYEGYQYTSKPVEPVVWTPITLPSGHYVRLHSITTPYGNGWSVDTQGSPDYWYHFMGWSKTTVKVPSSGKITVSGVFLKYDTIPYIGDTLLRSYVGIYVLNSDGTNILGTGFAVYQDDSINVWYSRDVTISGLTPGQDVTMGIGRMDEWVTDHSLYAKWVNLHITTGASILNIK